jgi:amino acid permease
MVYVQVANLARVLHADRSIAHLGRDTFPSHPRRLWLMARACYHYHRPRCSSMSYHLACLIHLETYANTLKFYTAVAPMDAEAFFISYLALPVVILFYIIGYIWKRGKWLKLSEIDVDSGRREIDWVAFNEEKQKLATGPAWKRVFHKVF